MGKGMKAGKRPKAPGAGNMQKQMQQMQQMQRKMDELQAEINEMEATATSGGGAVTVTVSGKNEALRQMEEISQNEMSKLTAGLGIPGL